MTTLLTIFERDLRDRLLDVIYSQWRDLGIPFSAPLAVSNEVIDPEALIWSTLEFLQTEPRLREGLISWIVTYENTIISQRLRRHKSDNDKRNLYWDTLKSPRRSRLYSNLNTRWNQGCSQDQLELSEELLDQKLRLYRSEERAGRRAAGSSTILLRARDILGGDNRHFLAIYLLANNGGGKLKTVAQWSGYTYRSIFDTATRWESARILTIDHGYCRLNDPGPWRDIFSCRTDEVIVVDWFEVFNAYIQLLRNIRKAQQNEFSLESSVVSSYRRQTREVLTNAILVSSGVDHPAVDHLKALL